jgi:hypothetical protein
VPLSLPFAIVGALIATRQRHNPIGWLLCGFGLVVAVPLVGNQYSRYALVTAPGSLPAGDWAAWLAVWPVELTALLSILVLLLFPNGHSLSAPGLAGGHPRHGQRRDLSAVGSQLP